MTEKKDLVEPIKNDGFAEHMGFGVQIRTNNWAKDQSEVKSERYGILFGANADGPETRESFVQKLRRLADAIECQEGSVSEQQSLWHNELNYDELKSAGVIEDCPYTVWDSYRRKKLESRIATLIEDFLDK